MKLWQGLLIAVLLVALPVMSGCAYGSKISASEAIAIVRQYEIDVRGGLGMGVGGEWGASYKGKGHWVVTFHRDEDAYSWNYYEGSGIIERRWQIK